MTRAIILFAAVLLVLMAMTGCSAPDRTASTDTAGMEGGGCEYCTCENCPGTGRCEGCANAMKDQADSGN